MKISGLRTKRFQIKSPKGDILPLMDCMFILLIYFVLMMIEMVEHPGLKLITARSYTSNELTKSFNSIGINQLGELYLNKKKINLINLEEELQLLELDDQTREGKKIFLTVDQKANSHVVFNVMETLRKMEKRSVFIETKTKE